MTPMQKLILGLNEDPLVEITKNCKLHHAIINDFNKLVAAAQKDNIDLTIASPFRSFERQQLIWNKKARGLSPVKDADNKVINPDLCSDEQLLNYILHWSALPGASRHHWGTDMDVYAPSMLTNSLQLEPWEYQKNGPMQKLGSWLDNNLTDYGFYRPYSTFNDGVAIEPWHISHVAQSTPLFEQLNIELLEQVITEHDIGFKPQILSQLDRIYDQYIINITLP